MVRFMLDEGPGVDIDENEAVVEDRDVAELSRWSREREREQARSRRGVTPVT